MKLVGHNEIVYNESKIIQVIIDPSLRPDRVTDYLEFIKNYANYKKWFFGHYHDNRNRSDKEILIYEQIIRIS